MQVFFSAIVDSPLAYQPVSFVAQSLSAWGRHRQSKRLSPLGHLLYVTLISQRSTESHGFFPGTPDSYTTGNFDSVGWK